MTVLCPSCRRAIRVPPDKVAVQNLRAKCPGCQTVFVVAEASIAPDAPAPSSAPAPAASPRAVPVPQPSAPQTAATPPPVIVASQPAPPAAATPRPSPQAAGTVGTAPPRAAATSTPAAAAARTHARSTNWRRCANHPQARSETYCPACKKGLCHDCSKHFQNAFICPECDGLCVTAAEQEARETRERERARPLREDLGQILRYPLVDPIAYVLLAIFVWGFRVAAGMAAFGGAFGALFSQGLLMAYAFTAVNRVSSGNTKSFMPSISDISDLAGPVKLGFGALLISAGPLLALLFLMPVQQALSLSGAREHSSFLETAHAQEPPSPEPAEPESPGEEAETEEDAEEPAEGVPGEGAEPTPEPDIDSLLLQEPAEASLPEAPLVPIWGWVLVGLAFAWNIVYAPVALTVAAISQSFLQTLNPLLGIDTIQRMGGVYWRAMGYYTAITAVQLLLGFGFGLIPILGGIVRAFVDSWALLSIGCLLGRAVYKRAAELDLD